MKLTAQLKLLTTSEQANLLHETMAAVNAAATYAARVGFDRQVYGQVSIHRACYLEIRAKFGLPSNVAIRAIAKAVECFARDKAVCPEFSPDSAVPCSDRTYRITSLQTVSLATIHGRIKVPYVVGDYFKSMLARKMGEADLIFRDGQFYLYVTVEFPEEPPIEVKDFIGVDLGIVQLATDSEGEASSGEAVDRNRKRRQTARKQHQRKGTKGARRKLKRMSGRQHRFQTTTNHLISKKLVAKAKAQSSGIALEDLKGIRDRLEDTVSRRFRRRFGNWSFLQLRTFIGYKARLAGVLVVPVDPRNTSRTCSACGHCEKANRKSQAEFCCKQCGFSLNADWNAALNLRQRGREVWAASKPAPKVATAQVSDKTVKL